MMAGIPCKLSRHYRVQFPMISSSRSPTFHPSSVPHPRSRKNTDSSAPDTHWCVLSAWISASSTTYTVFHPRMYILLDTTLVTDVNKYSVTTASCQQRWRTNWWIHLYLPLRCRAKDCGLSWDDESQQSSSRWLSVSQSRHMSATLLSNCWWLHLWAARDRSLLTSCRHHS